MLQIIGKAAIWNFQLFHLVSNPKGFGTSFALIPKQRRQKTEKGMEAKKILIVDDEFNTRFAVDFTLSNTGYETTQAKDGEEALTVLKERQSTKQYFDLVITDIQMPGMNGLELIDGIQKADIRVPLLVITGFGDKKTLIELLRRDCDDYLDKPFSPEDLLTAVERVLSKHNKARQSVKVLNEKLWESEKMSVLGQIASTIAHEINNPAQVIQGLSEMLLNDAKIDNKTKEWVHNIYDAAQFIAKLNRDLMNLAKPKETKTTAFRPEAPLEKAIEFMKETGVIKHCKIDRHYQDDFPLVRGDLMQLTQVFLNLIINAAHAMKDIQEKFLIVSTNHTPDENHLLISIQDNGCGIPDEHLEQIFEPYFTTRVSQDGAGLGLVVVRQIIEKHGGTIKVDSVVGKGTTFTISMPRESAAAMLQVRKKMAAVHLSPG